MSSSLSLRTELAFFGLLTGLLVCIAHAQGLVSAYAINDDARQQLYWMQSWSDPALYAGDWLTDYARRYVPWGVKALYWLASFFIAPLAFSKALTCALMIGLGLCLHQLGETLAGRSAGRAAILVFWLSPFFLHNISGGLARAFAGPLLALLLLGWLRRSPRVIGVSLLLQGVLIPYIFLLSAVALGLDWLAGRFGKSKPVFPTRPAQYLIFFLAAGMTLAFNLELQGSGFGPMVTVADMAGKPEYGPQGRFAVFPTPSLAYELAVRPFERFLALKPQTALPRLLGAGLLAGALLFFGRRADWSAFRRHGQPFLFLGLGSLALYYAAKLLAARLFIPSRYLEYSAAICYTLALGLCLAAALDWLGRRRFWRSRTVAALSLTALAVLAGLGLKNESLFDYGADVGLYEALRQTPKDSLLAGHPFLMDNALTFGQRRVYISYELTHPWSKGLWEKQAPRLRKLFDAYYASDPALVRAFCEQERIDFLLVDERHFSREFLDNQRPTAPVCELTPLPDAARRLCSALVPGVRLPYETPYTELYPDDPPFFEPFRTQIRQLAGSGRRFALLEDFPYRRVSDHIRLIDARLLQRP